MRSISDKAKKRLLSLSGTGLAVLFWILVWQVGSMLVPYDFILPSPFETLKALFSLFCTRAFPKTVCSSLFRILLGLLTGTLLGILLAVPAKFLPFFRRLLRPMMTVIRSTPVASFIILLWAMIGGTGVPAAVSVLMVAPLIWETVLGGMDAAPDKLLEVGKVFRFTPFTSFRYIYFPTVLRAFLPAFVSAVGLAWKAGVAAEVIVYLRDSIGQNISAAKAELNGPALYAWTLTVILLSLILEKGAKYLCERYTERHVAPQ